MHVDNRLPIDDRLLFLRYALPCSEALVKRGTVTQEHIDNLVRLVSENILPEEGAENIFKVATAMCTVMAKGMGKKTIDAEVIRRYFLLEHSRVVDERFALMRDFNPVECKTYSGKVIKAEADSALVRTALGEKRYKTVFAKDIEKGDNVAVHFDFVVEKISDSIANKMNGASVEKTKTAK